MKRDYSTYERGSGSYRAEELIEAGDSAKKDVSLIFRPSGYTYSPSTNVNRTHKWEEGLRLNTSNGLYAKESYTSLERMEKDAVGQLAESAEDLLQLHRKSQPQVRLPAG